MRGKVALFIILAVLAILGGAWIWSPYGPLSFSKSEDIANIAIEFHGMIFDVILFGIILTLYETITDKRDKIRKYKEEIEDYLGWDEKEAMYRIVGNINRLNMLGVSRMVLARANLEGAYLWGADLEQSSLYEANLKGADLSSVNMQGAHLLSAKMNGAKLINANLKGTNLIEANLEDAELKGALLEGAVAHLSQRKGFEKVMTKEQLDSIEWFPDPPVRPYHRTNLHYCIAKTKKGIPCKNPPKPGYEKCHIHLKQENQNS